MNNMFCSLAVFLLEYLKLLLSSVFILKLKVNHNKKTTGIFIATLIAVGLVSFTIDVSSYSIILSVIGILLILYEQSQKRKIGLVFIIYFFISLVDMASESCVYFFLDISTADAIEKYWITFFADSLSLILISIYSVVVSRNNHTVFMQSLPASYIFIFIVGGIAQVFYIACVQFFQIQKNNENSYKGTVALILSISGSIVFIIFCLLLLKNKNKNEMLIRNSEINAKLLKTQEEYYKMLLKKEDETKKFRHDIKNHIFCMYTLFKNKKYDELERYFLDIQNTLEVLRSGVNTGNVLIDAIINDISSCHKDVSLVWKGCMPNSMKISSMNLCTVFSNLISNAYEAAEKADDKRVFVSVKVLETNLFVSVKNHAAEPVTADGSIISSKTESGHGYGISNVRQCVEEIKGSFNISFENGFFTAEVIFPNVI